MKSSFTLIAFAILGLVLAHAGAYNRSGVQGGFAFQIKDFNP